MWKRWVLFWNEGLWNFSLSEIVGWKKKFYKWLRIYTAAIRGFHNDACTIRVSSLTFYSLMSIVPMLALSFGIARGFGAAEYLRSELLIHFEEQETAISEVIQFAEHLLEQTRGGLIAGVGCIVLFWSALRLLANIENVLNHIWEIHKMRSIRMIITEYVSFLLIAPLFFVLSNSTVFFASKYLEKWAHYLPVSATITSILIFFIHLLPYCLFWLFFTFLYYFLPNTKVRLTSAFTGGITAGTLYLLVQWGYIFFQLQASSYGAIYGSFAAVPLLLIWLQLSWFLFLFGAEVSYSHQTLENKEYEPAVDKISFGLKKTVSLWILHLCIQRFRKEHLPTSLHWLVHAAKIPAALAKPILEGLVQAKLLIETLEHGFIPNRPIDQLKISDVIQALEETGTNELPFLRSKELARFEKTLQAFKGIIENSGENSLYSWID